jgi:Lipocalin-like domain
MSQQSNSLRDRPQPVIEGTYRLKSSTRTSVLTGEVEDTLGENPVGFIMYGRDHRMMVLMVRSDRPKPSYGDISDADRVALFNSMAAYSGTYVFDGKIIVHTIDASWNEILTGTNQVRSVRVDGDLLIYTRSAGPAPIDGKLMTSTLIWEKLPGPTHADSSEG